MRSAFLNRHAELFQTTTLISQCAACETNVTHACGSVHVKLFVSLVYFRQNSDPLTAHKYQYST